MVLALVVLGGLAAYVDPDRHPAGLQEPGGPDAGLLQRDAGREHREEHHRADGARGGPGVGRPRGMESRSIVGDQHRPRLLPQQRRPQRRADRGQLAGRLGISHDAAGHAAAGRPAVRPDERDAGLPGRARQPDPERGDPLRRRAVRGPAADHVAARAPSRRWSTAARSARS